MANKIDAKQFLKSHLQDKINNILVFFKHERLEEKYNFKKEHNPDNLKVKVVSANCLTMLTL